MRFPISANNFPISGMLRSQAVFSFARLGQQVVFLARVSKNFFDPASCVHSSLWIIVSSGMLVMFPTIWQQIRGIQASTHSFMSCLPVHPYLQTFLHGAWPALDVHPKFLILGVDRRDLSCEQCTSPPPCNKVLLLVLSWLHSAINTENQMSTESLACQTLTG